MAAATTAEIPAVQTSTSAQTVTLGIDKDGQILQHDRSAGDLLAHEPGSLLGTDLGSLIAGPESGEPLTALIDAVRADREITTVLSVRTASRSRSTPSSPWSRSVPGTPSWSRR